MHSVARRTWIVGACAVAVLALGTSSVSAVEVTLTPSKDTSLYSQNGSSSNGAGAFLFSGETSFAGTRRALLAFDVAGSIPAGATIDSVTLTLHLSQAPVSSPGARNFDLQRLVSDWGESTSDAGSPGGFGAPAAAGDATWTHAFFNTVLWATPGGDIAAGVSTSAAADQIGFYTWGSTPQFVADVQDMLDNPATNFGWALIGEEGIPQSARRFDSRENANASFQPVLTVNFTTDGGPPPDGVPTVSEWGLILMGLLFLTAGTILFGRRRAVPAGGPPGVDLGAPGRIFFPALFARMLATTLALVAAGAFVAVAVFGELSLTDIAGSLLCAPVLAYLLHLWMAPRD